MECSKSYLYAYNLKRHARKFHSGLNQWPDKTASEIVFKSDIVKEESTPCEDKLGNSRNEKNMQHSAKAVMQAEQNSTAAATNVKSPIYTIVTHIYSFS